MQHDLSTLSGRELRRLLDSARQRGQAAQSYQILQEMARRREGGERRRRPGSRRPAEPRVISLDLGDPLERREDPLDLPEPPGELALEIPDPPAEPAALDPAPDPEAPAEPEPPAVLTLEREPRAAPRPRRLNASLFVFAAGTAVGVGVGAWVGDDARAALARFTGTAAVQTAAAAAPAIPVETAPLVPIDEAPAPPPEPEPAVAAPAPEHLQVVLTSPDGEDLAPPPVAAPEPQAEPAAAGTCAAEPTPADRTICGDPELQRLQGELRQAYAEALEAHADRALLRQRQLAWADGRKSVTDRDRLAGLYEERIRKLNAAAADARRRKR